MSNPVLEAIQTRRSVRSYTDRALSGEQVQNLVTAALASPTAMNRQAWHFVVVKNRELILEMERAVVQYFADAGDAGTIERLKSRNNKIFYDAPVVIFVSVDENAKPMTDAGIAVENIALAAQGMGLGSVILGLPGVLFNGADAEKWKGKLKFPQGYGFGIAVAVGHTAGEGSPHKPDPAKVTVID